ncbi:MAG: hypothetical protein ACRC1K_26555 [Planctomycetia bacterium]
MGGWGGGYRSKRWNAKATTAEHFSLDVRQWRRESWLTPGRKFIALCRCDGRTIGCVGVTVAEDFVVFKYGFSGGGRTTNVEQRVSLDWTPWQVYRTR